MKSIRYFLPLLLIPFCLISCGSDSDEASDDGLLDVLMRNKWVLHDPSLSVYGDDELELREDVHCLYFSSDKEGGEVTINKILDTEGTDAWYRDISNFTYSISGKRVTLRYSKSGSMELEYTNGHLEHGSLVYYPSSINSSDRSVIQEIQLHGDYDFDYGIGFDDQSPSSSTQYNSRTRKYSHTIFFSFIAPSDAKQRGIQDFGVAITTSDGTVETSAGYVKDAYVSIHNLGNRKNVRCFTGTINGEGRQSWNSSITITSDKKTITLDYTPVFYAGRNPYIREEQGKYFSVDSKDYIYRDNFSSEEYTPGRIVDENGRVISDEENNTGGGGETANTSCPDSRHPHMIDLGLPSGTKWACCNVGANKPEEYGGYYAWGETSEKSNYNWSTYKYGSSSSNVDNIGSDIAGSQYDVARLKWGTPWRMPSLNQIKELLNKTTSEWIKVNGIYGRKFTGTNNRSIFLPAAGRRLDGGLYGAGSDGDYWSSTLGEGDPDRAYSLNVFSGNAYWSYNNRFYGLSVRPVRLN